MACTGVAVGDSAWTAEAVCGQRQCYLALNVCTERKQPRVHGAAFAARVRAIRSDRSTVCTKRKFVTLNQELKNDSFITQLSPMFMTSKSKSCLADPGN